jgi:hypothetical protein
MDMKQPQPASVGSMDGSASVDYRKMAQRKWGRRAAWITGKGPFAVLAHCRVLTVTLWTSLEKAQAAKKQIDEHACGGRCNRDHEIINLSAPNK